MLLARPRHVLRVRRVPERRGPPVVHVEEVHRRHLRRRAAPVAEVLPRAETSSPPRSGSTGTSGAFERRGAAGSWVGAGRQVQPGPAEWPRLHLMYHLAQKSDVVQVVLHTLRVRQDPLCPEPTVADVPERVVLLRDAQDVRREAVQEQPWPESVPRCDGAPRSSARGAGGPDGGRGRPREEDRWVHRCRRLRLRGRGGWGS